MSSGQGGSTDDRSLLCSSIPPRITFETKGDVTARRPRPLSEIQGELLRNLADLVELALAGFVLLDHIRHTCHDGFVMSALRTTSVFRKRLKAARQLRGLSQADLAERTGLPPSAVSHYETGTRRPSFTNLRRLAEAMEVTTDYLVGRSKRPDGADPSDEPLMRDFERLSLDDRRLARELVANLARRSPKGARS